MVSADTFFNRLRLRLPLRRKLVYRDFDRDYEVEDFFIVREYDFGLLGYWALLELRLSSGLSVRVLSLFFSQMQRKGYGRPVFGGCADVF